MKVTVPRNVRIALKIATSILPKLPQKGDSWLQIAVKTLGIMNSVDEIMFPSSHSQVQAIVDRYDLQVASNKQFVEIFFGTNLREQFKVRLTHTHSADHMKIIEADSDNYGRLLFMEGYRDGDVRCEFYHSKGMDFMALMNQLWEGYDGRIQVTSVKNTYGEQESALTTFNTCPNPLYGVLHGRMKHLVTRHRRFAVDKIPRTYMLYGPPGTGKSSFATQFAERLGSRSLRMEARTFATQDVKNMMFLLHSMQPDFLIIDDVDKADMSEDIPAILEIMQRFKSDHSTMSVIMTSNAITGFDPGFLRPGRIDTWVEFQLPEEAERLDVLTRYSEEFKVLATKEQIAGLTTVTAGLSHDYLREIAQLLRYDDAESVMSTVALMKKLQVPAAK